MHDRGYIKWAPFNALINDKIIYKESLLKCSECKKPTLSEDQLYELNEKIFEAYTNHIEVTLSIFKDKRIIDIIGYINNIHIDKKIITFNNNYIYLNQIIKITFF